MIIFPYRLENNESFLAKQPCPLAYIPREQVLSNPFVPIFPDFSHPSDDFLPALGSKNQGGFWGVAFRLDNHAYASNNHAQKSRCDIWAIRYQAYREDQIAGGETCNPFRAIGSAQVFPGAYSALSLSPLSSFFFLY